MVVVLKCNEPDFPDLTFGQAYAVIGIEASEYRLLNDAGQPYLYPHELFEVADPHEPGDWICEVGEDGECYAYPPPLNAVGFFEDFFNGKPEAVGALWQAVNHRLAMAG